MSNWALRLAVFALALVLGLAAAFFASGIYLGPCGFGYSLPWAASNVEVQTDPAADDRAIYAAVYKDQELDKNPPLIGESTSQLRMDDFEDPTSNPLATPDEIADFQAKNSEPISIRPLVSEIKVLGFITHDELKTLFLKNSHVTDGWSAFHKKYPEANGDLWFSRIGYNSDRTRAIVYFSHVCGGLCGKGGWLNYKKEAGVWHRYGEQMLWVS